MNLKRVLIGSVFSLGLTAAAQESLHPYATPQDSIEYRKEVETMMNVSGSSKALEIMMPQLKAAIQSKIVEGEGREMALQMIEDFFDQFADDMLDLIVPIYRTYFTLQDVKELNVFYTSPIGQKFSANMNDITLDALRAGQNYAQEKMREAFQKLEEKKLLIEI